MTTEPPNIIIDIAKHHARRSPCRSKRGVVVYAPASTGSLIYGAGHNGPPAPFTCPGRDRCAGICGQLSVHAEVRALHDVRARYSAVYDLVHVELADDGGIVACAGPSCSQCSGVILEHRFVASVWLYEAVPEGAAWRRYTAAEFHQITLERTGLLR